MTEDNLIQQSLFDDETKTVTTESNISECKNLTNETLANNGKCRPRMRKNSLTSNCNKSISSNINTQDLISDISNSFKTVDKEKLAPVLKHYVSLKEENENHLLLYRLGDFFECFFEDAILISETLEITLTSKDGGKAIGRVPMAGIPHHALERYSSELIKKNHSIVICDQIEKSLGKNGGPIKRAITRIITPGTVIEEGMLVAKKNNWITAIYIEETKSTEDTLWGISRADVSTGELISLEGQSLSKLRDELTKLDASEIIIGSEVEKNLLAIQGKLLKFTITQKTDFSINEASKAIKTYFKVNTLEGLGLKHLNNATKSLGGLLAYLLTINPSEHENTSSVKFHWIFHR